MKFFKNFDWDWFGSKARKTNVELQEQIEKYKNNENRYFRKLLYSNGILTVIFNDGNIISATKPFEMINTIQKASSEAEIMALLSEQAISKADIREKEDEENIKRLSQYNEEVIELLGNDFSYKGNEFYYKHITLPLPAIVLSTLIEHAKNNDTDQFNRIVNFFLLLATSPLEECRNSVLKFCKNNDIHISPKGNLITYRKVVKIDKKNENQELINFVIEKRTQIKAQKRGPSNYFVYFESETGEYTLSRGEIINPPDTYELKGNLKELYKEFILPPLEEEQWYTSKHNKGKYKFRIGDVYKLGDGEEPNPNVGNCHSQGLHSSCVNYNYSGYGDTAIIAIVNPAKSIFVPTSETGKFRTQEMKIACLNPNEHGVHIDEELIKQADEEYSEYTINELEEMLKDKSFASISLEENVPQINLIDLKLISESLRNKIVLI